VLSYLAEHGVQASREDMQALSDATGAALKDRQRMTHPEPTAQLEPPPADPSAAMPDAAAVDRIRAILEAPEAIGRETFARPLAINSPLSVEQARAMLLTVPVGSDADTTTAPVDPWAAAKRIADILNSFEAGGRRKAAQHLARNTAVSV